jgi:nucleoid DNA-binding protein
MSNGKPKPMSKSALYAELAQTTGLSRKQVGSVFDATNELIKREMGKKGPGLFVLPGLIKITRKRKEATPKQIKPNPFKPGEMMEIPPKPAKNIVRARPLKSLREMAK